jgi:hypothetical protein
MFTSMIVGAAARGQPHPAMPIPGGVRLPADGHAGRMAWFRGDCHVHSALSAGGELTPAQLIVAARAAGLDFLAVTEHNRPPAYAEWATDDPLVIPGREVTTPKGHWLALGLSPGQEIDGQPEQVRAAALTNPVFLDG